MAQGLTALTSVVMRRHKTKVPKVAGALGGGECKRSFQITIIKRPRRRESRQVCSRRCLRPLVSRGIVGHCGILWQAVPRKIAVLGLPAGRVPPRAAVPLILSFLETSTGPSIDFMYLMDEREMRRKVSDSSEEPQPLWHRVVYLLLSLKSCIPKEQKHEKGTTTLN